MLGCSPLLRMGAVYNLMSKIMAFLGGLKPRLVAIPEPPTQRATLSSVGLSFWVTPDAPK